LGFLVSASFIGVLDRGNEFSGFESADLSSTYFSVNDLILSNFSIFLTSSLIFIYSIFGLASVLVLIFDYADSYSLVMTSLLCSNLLDFIAFLDISILDFTESEISKGSTSLVTT